MFALTKRGGLVIYRHSVSAEWEPSTRPAFPVAPENPRGRRPSFISMFGSGQLSVRSYFYLTDRAWCAYTRLAKSVT